MPAFHFSHAQQLLQVCEVRSSCGLGPLGLSFKGKVAEDMVYRFGREQCANENHELQSKRLCQNSNNVNEIGTVNSKKKLLRPVHVQLATVQ